MPYDKQKPKNEEAQDKPADIWAELEDRKKKGLWDGEIDIVQIKEYPLTAGEHYFQITNIRKREITCTACAVQHGGILEAHLLHRYKVENGIIYLDNKPMTKTAQKGS